MDENITLENFYITTVEDDIFLHTVAAGLLAAPFGKPADDLIRDARVMGVMIEDNRPDNITLRWPGQPDAIGILIREVP